MSHVKDQFGVGKSDILHVAQSLYHDHTPAAKINLHSCWIDRYGLDLGDSKDTTAKFGWKVKTLAELADLVEKAFTDSN
jgi:FMN phosphatase YigB (HAD superfamily)